MLFRSLIWCEVAHVLRSVAAALAYAHDNGVLHLDIKPANVMVARDGSVKLADFGMASIASAAGWGGARGGTVGYMPPEQLTGDLVDERTDVFALAAGFHIHDGHKPPGVVLDAVFGGVVCDHGGVVFGFTFGGNEGIGVMDEKLFQGMEAHDSNEGCDCQDRKSTRLNSSH